MYLQEHVSLKALNTFHVAARARYYAAIKDLQTLQALVADKTWNQWPWLVLGGGSNLLFVKDFEGVVLRMALDGVATVKEDRHHIWVKAGAGISWHALVLHCVAHEYAGIENLSLIPGTVGAAPIQNIGAYGVELSNVFDSLEAMELCSGAIRTFDKADCAFGYRDSVFKQTLKGQYIILNVTLKLAKQPTFQVAYRGLQDTLEAMQVANLSIKAVSDAVIRLRQQKLPDPTVLGNAGSFFKNPLLTRHQLAQLQQQHPHLPHYDQPDGSVKVSAAWLIEQCGWKGKRQGAVGVYDRHALVLVNHGEGTGAEVQELAQTIQRSVQDTFGIALAPEVSSITGAVC